MMTRCECWQLSFVGLMAYARRHGITTLAELAQATGCGTGCGSCRPYLEELLRTGKLRCGDQLIDLPGAENCAAASPGQERSADSAESAPPAQQARPQTLNHPDAPPVGPDEAEAPKQKVLDRKSVV